METSKLGYVNPPVLSNSVAAQRKNSMDIQATRTAVYVHTVAALPPQPHTQEQLPAAPQDPTTLHLTVAPIYSKQTIPFLTFQVSGGLQLQPQGSSLVAAAPTAKPKSSGKHVCHHCGRDCMKPSVLEKHLRCHTGERPYPCTTCGISFKTQSNLYKHKRTQAHARLSSESVQSSQDSLHTSSFSQDVSGDTSGSQDHDVGGLPTQITSSAIALRDLSEQGPGENTDSALQQTEVSNSVVPVTEQREANSLAKNTKPAEANNEKAEENDKEKTKENQKPALTSNRHVPLQRQEATRFSKQWESSTSRGKSQSHDSTDSGFSESSEQLWNSSPGSALPGHSMESLTESSMELCNMSNSMQTNTEPGHTVQEAKTSVSEQEQKTLEERISKLISENDAVVDDKHLENVRPRKTVLSKQGSIDLPVPYTYKDSFHFEMKTAAGLAWRTPDRGGRLGLYNSVPTQPSTSVEHAPLTRSSSLPFGVALLHSERSISALQKDQVALARRGSSGHIYLRDFATKSVDQQVSNHRPLVRQAAVDCVTTTEGLARNSSTEEVCTGSLSLDGDGIDVCGESSSRKSGKKKTQKFAYSKWYMYGGGTFKKMYNTTKSCDNIVMKTRKSITNLDHDKDQGIQRRLSSTHNSPITTMGSSIDTSTVSSATVCYTSCLPANLPPVTGLHKTAGLFHSSCTPLKPPLIRSLSLSTMQSSSIASMDSHKKDIANRNMSEKVVHKEHNDLISQNCEGPIPSERKKQRTENATMCPLGTQIESTTSKTLTQSFPPIAGTGSSRLQLHGNNVNLSFDCVQTRNLTPLKGTVSSPCILNANGTYGGVSTVSSNSLTKAKTSFLPKYQLKLPNSMETESVSLPLILNQTTGTEDPGSMTAPRFSSNIYQTSTTATPSTLSNQRCITPMISLSGHTHRMNTPAVCPAVCPAQGPTAPPITVTHSLSLTSVTGPRLNLVSNCPKLHEQPVAITDTTVSQIANPTTASLQIHHTKHSLTESDSAHNSLTTPIPMLGQKSSSADTVSTQNQCPPLSYTQEALPSHHAHPVNSVKSGPSNPITPCHIIPFNDSAQPATQKIFHVRTADLQICLQIISDEQLALIEPHIERQGIACDVSLFSRKDHDPKESAKTNADSGIPNITNVYVTGESSNMDLSCKVTQHKKQMGPESPALQNAESITNMPPVNFPQIGSSTHVNEHSNVSHVKKWLTSSANAKQMCPDRQDPSPLLRPQISTNGSKQTLATTGGVTSSTDSQKGEKLQRSQVTVMEDVLLLRTPSEQQLLPKGKSVSEKGTFSEMLSGQNKLCLAAITSLSPTPEAQSSSGSRSLKLVGQHKPVNQKVTCNMGKLKTEHEALVHEALSSEKMVEESSLSRQAWQSARSKIESCDDPSSKASLLFNNNSFRVERETPCSSQHAAIERTSQSLPPQGMTLNDQDRSTSNHADNQLAQITSVPSSSLEERPKDGTVGLETQQDPETVDVTGSSLTGCAARKEPETAASTGTPQQPDATDKEHMESQREGIGMDGERNNRVWSSTQKDNVLEQIEELNARDEEDCHFNSRLPEHDPLHFSQRQTIMFGSPQKQALWDTTPSDSLHCYKSSNSTVFNSAQPKVEANSVHILQRPSHFETSIFLRKDSVQLNEESSLLQISKAFSWVETRNTQTPPLFIQNEANSNQNHQTEDQGNTTIPTVKPPHQCSPQMCYNNSISMSEQQRPASPLPEVKAPPSTYSSLLPQPVHVKRDTFRVTGNSQADINIMSNTQFDPFQHCISMDPDQHNKAERLNETTYIHMTPGGDPFRPGGSNKYQSLLSTDQLYSYQLADCQTTGVRLAQGSHDDSDDTSSSDDEGKLIIEL